MAYEYIKLGILGGMGPMASAEFLRTIYEHNVQPIEQESPEIILLSRPSFRDRWAAIEFNDDALLEQVVEALGVMTEQGAERLILCCVTLHFLLDQIPPKLRRLITSLIDVVMTEALRLGESALVLCAHGTRRARLFERHALWDSVRHLLVFPDDSDQNIIHNALHRYKVCPDDHILLKYLPMFIEKYQTRTLIAGCSELHFLTKHLLKTQNSSCRIIDPLLWIAQNLHKAPQDGNDPDVTCMRQK